MTSVRAVCGGIKETILLLAMVSLAGCGTVEHSIRLEDKEAFSHETKVTVGLVTNRSGESFETDVEQLLRDAFVGRLQEEGLYNSKAGDHVLTLNANITDYDKGDAFKRWLMPGYGATVLAVECSLLDSDGNVDAVVTVKRTVEAGGGYTVGAWKSIFNSIAGDVVENLKSQGKE